MCTELEPIENGAIAYDPVNQESEFNLGTVATYSCEDGFALVGPETRTCVEVETMGEFNAVAPTCERKFVVLFRKFYSYEYSFPQLLCALS